MRILLVYPRYPDTFWSFRHALKFIGRKASFPPLGLLTVAAMLPEAWEKRLVDLNVRPLSDADLAWADYVFISAMSIQRASVQEILERCRKGRVPTVAGGPLFTACHDDFPQVDHLVLGEAELTLPAFLADLERGGPRRIYAEEGWPDLAETPLPLWDLIDPGEYAAMNIQYSRGCPFDCEFCDITALFGRRPRSKPRARLMEELDSLHERGWRGRVFFVDDNFIGDRRKLKEQVLPALIEWMEAHGHPFRFFTEASIDLADDPELLALMVRAGFEEVFVGIETPADEGLAESGKVQNRGRDLLECVRRIQRAGIQVQGGFIVGFDSDAPGIFERQSRFIQESGIATAMVGMLTALRGTQLHQRLSREGRLLEEASGDNTSVSINFIPKMDSDLLTEGYRTLLKTLYAPQNYYRRVMRLLREYRPPVHGRFRMQPGYLGAVCKSVVLLGIVGKERLHFWHLFFWSLCTRPRLFPLAITYSIYGFHFRKIVEKVTSAGSH